MKGNRILFLDLDRTLLNNDKSISEENRTAVNQALEEGNYVTIATGRAVESGRIVAKDLGLTKPGCYMIAYNGAVLYDCSADRILYDKTIPVQDVLYLFDRAKEAGIYIQTYNKKGVLAEKHTKELDYYVKNSRMSYKLLDSLAQQLEEEPHKVMLIDLESSEKLQKFQEEQAAWAEGKLTSFFSCMEYLEYCPCGVCKGSAIGYLCSLLNIPQEFTVAVGDERNDISMIEAAGTGVAVANAVPQAKAAADYITERDNNHAAVAEVIRKFILSGENI